MEQFGFGPIAPKRNGEGGIVPIRSSSGLVPKERFVHERPTSSSECVSTDPCRILSAAFFCVFIAFAPPVRNPRLIASTYELNIHSSVVPGFDLIVSSHRLWYRSCPTTFGLHPLPSRHSQTIQPLGLSREFEDNKSATHNLYKLQKLIKNDLDSISDFNLDARTFCNEVNTLGGPYYVANFCTDEKLSSSSSNNNDYLNVEDESYTYLGNLRN
ncbi:hypothetical protein AGLY_009949 [Aphis glycines]|uniref:Uncharacterized protein n=1 Tax=Aphis glycines TaxID=307491 RepID=A0A6G0TGW0_APHGL|nr:hypothetical protein AGLY_009949 [Aphis glycines]